MTYVEIKLEEMKEFLENEGFILHKRDKKTEWVANKIYTTNGATYLIRVYTSINPDDRSRGVGKDAIRVGSFTSHGKWVVGSKRVNRTKNWRKNLLSRISDIEEKLDARIKAPDILTP